MVSKNVLNEVVSVCEKKVTGVVQKGLARCMNVG